MPDSTTLVSPVTGNINNPSLTVSAPTTDVNSNEPVELDSTPTSSEEINKRRRGSKATELTHLSPEERHKRVELIAERKKDPAVLVDVPSTPGAEEFGRVGGGAEGRVST